MKQDAGGELGAAPAELQWTGDGRGRQEMGGSGAVVAGSGGGGLAGGQWRPDPAIAAGVHWSWGHAGGVGWWSTMVLGGSGAPEG